MNMHDDDIDRELEQSIGKHSEYSEWKDGMAKDRHKQGLAMPSGYELQRLWNTYQREIGEQRRQQTKRLALIAGLKKKLRSVLAELSAAIGTSDKDEETLHLGTLAQMAMNDDDAGLDAMFAENDRKLREMVEAQEAASKNAQREQEELFGIANTAPSIEELQLAREKALRELDAPNEGELNDI